MRVIMMIKYWLFIVWLSAKWMFRVTLGDEVIYKGKRYFVANGTAAPYWDLQIKGGFQRVHLYQSEFKKVWSLSGLVRSFRSGYWFYMSSWYRIWVNEGIKPWMRGCNIF